MMWLIAIGIVVGIVAVISVILFVIMMFEYDSTHAIMVLAGFASFIALVLIVHSMLAQR